MGRLLAGQFNQRLGGKLACLLLICTATGCGHKGPLIAPEPNSPPAIEPTPKQLTLPAPQLQEQE